MNRLESFDQGLPLFPAGAGMNRGTEGEREYAYAVPRRRGDEPGDEEA